MLSSLIVIRYCYDLLIGQISTGLLLYSHVPTAIIALLFGFFMLYKAKKHDFSTTPLFLLCLSFAIWCFLDIGAWFAFLGSEVTMFTWSLIDIFSVSFFFLSYYFLYTFVKGRDLPLWQKAIGLLTFIPNLYFTITSANLITFDLNWCEAVETTLATNFAVYIEVLYMLLIIGFTLKEYFQAKKKELKTKVVMAGTGVTLFLFIFLLGLILEIFVGMFGLIEFSYNVEIYGLFGMPVMLIYLGYLIVKYKAFDLKVFTAQALATASIVIVATQFAFLHDPATMVLNGINLILVCFVGIALAKNVKKEIEAKEKIERQEKEMEEINAKLAVANDRLKELDRQKTEFVSFASHQLRSPLTAMRGYASLILEGDYGQVSDDLKKAAQIIFDSSKTLATVVDDYLNVSRIELGQMKFDFTKFDLKELVQAVIDEQKPNVEKAGLKLNFNAAAGDYLVNADREKLKQVISNIVDNSVKYTPKGEITVSIKKIKNKIQITTADTGIGISKDVIPKLFSKFTRAKDANKTNIRGTGLGLFIAKEIITAHKGNVWVESAGEGKGSQFYIELASA